MQRTLVQVLSHAHAIHINPSPVTCTCNTQILVLSHAHATHTCSSPVTCTCNTHTQILVLSHAHATHTCNRRLRHEPVNIHLKVHTHTTRLPTYACPRMPASHIASARLPTYACQRMPASHTASARPPCTQRDFYRLTSLLNVAMYDTLYSLVIENVEVTSLVI